MSQIREANKALAV